MTPELPLVKGFRISPGTELRLGRDDHARVQTRQLGVQELKQHWHAVAFLSLLTQSNAKSHPTKIASQAPLVRPRGRQLLQLGNALAPQRNHSKQGAKVPNYPVTGQPRLASGRAACPKNREIKRSRQHKAKCGKHATKSNNASVQPHKRIGGGRIRTWLSQTQGVFVPIYKQVSLQYAQTLVPILAYLPSRQFCLWMQVL